MASGDLILSSGTVITAAEIQQIAAEVKKELAAESKELAEFEEVSSLTGVSSLPGIQQSGTTMKLVRVALSVLKGVDGKSVELTASSTAVQWRYVGETEWNTLVELSLLKGDKGAQGIQGTPGLPPVIEMGTVTTLLPDSDVTATLTPNGETAAGNPKYLLNLGVPAGRPGQDGNGAGNVYINEAEKMESGKLYLFQPGADGMVNGYFVEYVGQQSVGQKNPDYPGAELFNDYENNIAAGQYAHAEGRETNATGPRAHAEGYKTSVFAADAHAEGRETVCIGAQSHAEGMYSIAFGALSHVEGIAAQIENGTYTLPSEGRKPILSDPDLIRSIWNEYGNTFGDEIAVSSKLLETYYVHGSFGERNHIEGINNVAFNNGNHVEGSCNQIGGSTTKHGSLYRDALAHIEGHKNECTIHEPDSSVHVEGKNNRIFQYAIYDLNTETSSYAYVSASHIEGEDNEINSGDMDSHKDTICSHIGGKYCIISCASYAFAHGYNLSVSNDYEVAFGRYNLSTLNDKKVLFSYGIGSSTERKNAFSVLEDGTVVIPNLEAENMTAAINAAIAPISTKVNNNYNELKGITNEHTRQIADLLKLIQEGGGGGSANAYVVGSTLVITSKLESSVEGEKLTITDSDASVTGEVLTIN